MLTSNPYNLPDKMLKPNQITKPITLQNKKSRDRSYDYSKQLSNKGIKIESQMKKSVNLQHITSSPNLHTPSTSSSTNRPIDAPNLPRQLEYHQTHIQSIVESEQDRRIKFLFEKFYQINEQLSNHDSLLMKLVNDKDKDRSSWDSPFELNGINHKISQETKPEVSISMANQQTQLVMKLISLQNKSIEQLKKEVTTLKQQISFINTSIGKQKQQQNNAFNLSRSIKFNGSVEFESINLERKFTQDFSRILQTVDQLRISTTDKIIKIQNNLHKIDGNNQTIGHKINKAQQRIDNMESSIQNHMNLVNKEINHALTKIVSSINEKIAKALDNNVLVVNDKLKKCIQTCKNVAAQNKKSQTTLNPNNIEGKSMINKAMILKLSGYRAEGKILKIKMKSALTLVDQKASEKANFYKINQESSQKKGDHSPSTQSTSSEQIILNSNIYHIDTDGYLMDENKVYLLDENNNLLQLEPNKLIQIKQIGCLL